jgi:tetratricopeptide (TPR) repeat protein
MVMQMFISYINELWAMQKKEKKIQTSRIKNSYFIICIIAITFIVFIPVINNQFINLDDDKFIYENDLIKSFSSEQISEIFKTHLFSPWYKPIVYLSWSIEYKFFQQSPTIFHLNNLFLHIINSVFVFCIVLIILKKLFVKSNSNNWTAFFIAMLFAVHPMKVESVAWAIERKDVLFSFFFLGSLLCYFRYYSRKKIIFLIIGSLLFGLGLLSKSMIITLPIVLFIIDYLFGRKFNYKLLVEKIPYLIVLFCGLFLYGMFSDFDSSLQGFTGKITQDNISNQIIPISQVPVFDRFIVSSYRVVIMVGHLVYPSKLSIVYPLSEYPSFIEGSPVKMYFFFILLISILLFSIFSHFYTRTRIILACTLFFIFTIIPILGMPGSSTSNVSDRYTYIPSIAIFLLIGFLLRTLAQKFRNLKVPIIVLSVGILLFFCIMTFNRCRVFNNSISLWNDVINKYPTSVVAYNNRSCAKCDLRDYEGAIIDLNHLISIDPSDPSAYNNRGVAYYIIKKHQQALDDYNIAIELKADYLKAHFNKGLVYEELKEYKQAISSFDMVNTLQPGFFEAYKRKGDIYLFNLLDYHSAIVEYDNGLLINPVHFEITNNRGVAKHKNGDLNEALIDYEKAAMFSPKNAIVYFNKGMVKIELGMKDLGCIDLYQSLKLGYKDADKEIKTHCQQLINE